MMTEKELYYTQLENDENAIEQANKPLKGIKGEKILCLGLVPFASLSIYSMIKKSHPFNQCCLFVNIYET